MARAPHDDLVEGFERQAPAAVRCLQEDFEAWNAQLQVPVNHQRVVRTTNRLERLFEEGRRRSKIAPTIAGERPVLKMLYASDSWRGIRVTELQRRQLERLQAQLAKKAKQENAPAVKTPSTTERISSSERT
jgi:transposase-like protein